MKKLLLIGFVLAILLLAFPQGVLAAAPKAVEVNASYGIASVTTFDAHLWDTMPTPWGLSVGDNTGNYMQFHLSTMDDWSVTGSDTSGSATTGYMVGSEHSLKTPFQIYSTFNGGFRDFTTPGLKIKEGASSTANQDWQEAIQQTVTNTDYASSTLYKIVLTFTCATDF